MEHLPDEAHFQHLPHLLVDEVLSLQCFAPDLLLDGQCVRVYVQAVLDDLHGDPGHVRWLPHEHVSVSPEEGDEHAFLFFAQVSSNGHSLL